MAGNKRTALLGRLPAVLAVFLAVGVFGLKAAAGDGMPMIFGTGIAQVLSGSMEPTLGVDDLVVVRRQDSYAVGDVVVYQSGSQLVVHRVIAAQGQTLITQGDANNTADSPIPASAVKGAVTARFPNAGTLLHILKTAAMLLLIVLWGVPLLKNLLKK